MNVYLHILFCELFALGIFLTTTMISSKTNKCYYGSFLLDKSEK